MITYAFTIPRASTASALLRQPWFAVLVASTAVDRLSCVSLGIIAERDFVVQVNESEARYYHYVFFVKQILSWRILLV